MMQYTYLAHRLPGPDVHATNSETGKTTACPEKNADPTTSHTRNLTMTHRSLYTNVRPCLRIVLSIVMQINTRTDLENFNAYVIRYTTFLMHT